MIGHGKARAIANRGQGQGFSGTQTLSGRIPGLRLRPEFVQHGCTNDLGLLCGRALRTRATRTGSISFVQRMAIAWLRANYVKLPMLMAKKAWTLTISKRRYLGVAGLLYLIGFLGLPNLRRILFCLGLLIGSYVLAIALTHVVWQRFLVPILPPLYVGMALGITWIVRSAKCKLARTPICKGGAPCIFL
jgi:hypothetical protein